MGYWAGRCHLEHTHSRAVCKYDYELQKDAEISHHRISNTDKNNPLEIITTTDEYGAMQKEDANFIALAANTYDKLLDIAEAADKLLKMSCIQQYREKLKETLEAMEKE